MSRRAELPPLASAATPRVRWGRLAAMYVALVVYGSLYPFSGWSAAPGGLLDFVAVPERRQFHGGDVLVNVLAYVPLGLLLVRALGRRLAPSWSLVLASLCGAALSFCVEFTQQFLPSRDASTVDLLTNSTGALVGAVLGTVLRIEAGPMAALRRWRRHWFRPGRLADLGLLAIALWALSQLSPFVPSIDIGELRHGLAPLWHTLLQPATFDRGQWGAYTLYIAGLALLARTLAMPGRAVGRLFVAFVAALLLYKAAVVSRQLSLEALAGACAGVVLASIGWRLREAPAAWIAALLILAGFAVDELRSDPSGVIYDFTWIAFSAQLQHPLIGIAAILENLWPATALATLARLAAGERRRAGVGIGGALLLAATAFALEWHQRELPGRVGDITTVLLMVGAWTAVWLVRLDRADRVDVQAGVQDGLPARADRSEHRAADRGPHRGSRRGSHRGSQGEAHRGAHRSRHRRRRRGARRAWIVAGALAAVAAVGAGSAMLARHPQEVRVDESKRPTLPRPEALPAANLPAFRFEHPRLPSPTPAEAKTLARANPEFLRELRRTASDGNGDFDAVILQAYLEPGSIDMQALLRRLVALQPAWRGHEQGKPLALAYDWLYGQWSTAQRAQLQSKLAEACTYLVERIRKDRMSPYNVYLYNAPLQALMACSIALYGDDARGEPLMRFTYDLWKNRVLPVWRQVMGSNGGWHEGGEYVGIGIGQAIHELPSMWRRATGEDLFASEPGIRGFLDFLVYRTRPDGTHFRWGDGAFFDRSVPDAVPLALELSHAAAYALSAPRAVVPSGWPWGPLTDPRLIDAQAPSRLPLTRLFDGIGMVVARSDWGPDATYVTFKAGDNYWSHEHLDEGAFTIYKGGPLAIDSGLYAPPYGSDHHMNYAYQTVAHNAVTVTDPADEVPAPGKDRPRPIANDGGQRRIGSGWGVEAAPLDLAEWRAKRETYHTGTMAQVLDADRLTVALADVTPAYTNALSGQGTFSHRTRRVERLWRTFGYDRVDDVVVVFDQVRATQAAFRKRWLLHTVHRPTVDGQTFRVGIEHEPRPGRAGGTLSARVLLPREALVNAVGGPGLEFLVDDRNYDEEGKLAQTIRKLGPNQGEPGAWRVEVSPPEDRADDLFLVVLLPTLGDAAASHHVRLLESAGRVGCEIVGPHRTTRWWFEPGQLRAQIEVVADGAPARLHRLEAPAPAAAPAPEGGWLERLRAWAGPRH